jgi:hypothetical protein
MEGISACRAMENRIEVNNTNSLVGRHAQTSNNWLFVTPVLNGIFGVCGDDLVRNQSKTASFHCCENHKANPIGIGNLDNIATTPFV